MASAELSGHSLARRNVQIISKLPGRVRLKVDLFYQQQKLARIVELILQTEPGIIRCRINPILGTVLMVYREQSISLTEMVQRMEECVKRENTSTSQLAHQYTPVLELEEQYFRSCKKSLVFGILYLTGRLKGRIWGKSPFHSEPLFFNLAVGAALIGGYPWLNSLCRKITCWFPIKLETILVSAGVLFSILRERTTGIFFLFLKFSLDALHYYCKLKMVESLQRLPENADLTTFTKAHLTDSLAIQEEVNRYQKKAIGIAVILSLAGYLIGSSSFSPVLILFLMLPGATQVAVDTGLIEYLHLLVKNKIYLHNISAAERFVGKGKLIIINPEEITNLELVTTENWFKMRWLIYKLKEAGYQLILLSQRPQGQIDQMGKLLGFQQVIGGQSTADQIRFVQNENSQTKTLVLGASTQANLPIFAVANFSICTLSGDDPVGTDIDCVFIEGNLEKLYHFLEYTKVSFRQIRDGVQYVKYYSLIFSLLAVVGKIDLGQIETITTMNSIFALLNSSQYAGLIGRHQRRREILHRGLHVDWQMPKKNSPV